MELNLCITKFKSNETKSEADIYDKTLKSIENDITGGNFNTSNIDSGQNKVIKKEKSTITITTTQNQKLNKDSNMTIIDLGPCEKLLRDAYKLNDDDLIYMETIEVFHEGMKAPIIEVNVFAKLNENKLVKLNFSVCQNEKMDLSFKVLIDEDLNKLNMSSPYYNDICYVDNSINGIYVPFEVRKTDYINNNKAVCQEDCIFAEYNYDNQKAKCSCSIKESSKSFSDMNINKTKLYENFVNIKNYVNLNILVCYKQLFSKKGLLHNIGFYIFIPIITFYFICIIIFYNKDMNIIKQSIKDITFGITNYKLVKETTKLKSATKKKRIVNNRIHNKNMNLLNMNKKR